MMKTIIVAMAVALCASVSMADLITVNADGNDQTWRSNGSSVWVGQSTARVGTDQAASFNAHVMPFLLPALPAGHAVTDVNITAVVDSANLWEASGVYLDIEGIRTAATSGTLATDMNGTVVADALYEMAPGFPTGTVVFGAGTASFTSYVQGLYDAGKAGEYAFISLTADAANPNNSRYFTIQSANGGTAPTLNITTAIPEPATAGILGLGALIVMMARRRIRK